MKPWLNRVNSRLSDQLTESLSKWRQLPEIKQKAVRLRAEGVTLEAIAAEIETPFPTVRDWLVPSGSCVEELEEFKAHLADKAIKNTDALMERAKIDAERIWSKLVALAEREDKTTPSHVILAAMDSVLDRAGIARVSKTEGKTTLTLTDEDRRKRFEAIKELQADLEPIQLKRLAGGKV